MSVKFGQCHLCPKNAPVMRLYGDGVCSYHLAHPGDDHSGQVVPEQVKAELERERLLKQFYQEQWQLMPTHCENGCGTRLLANTLRNAKFFICHIVPKRHFESVMVHPANRFFGCRQCHTKYDSNWMTAVKMPIWPLVAERFTSFMNLIKDTELKHLPDALRILMPNTDPC